MSAVITPPAEGGLQQAQAALREARQALKKGQAIPYLGPAILQVGQEVSPVPATPEALVERLVARATVPHKIRKRLTQAAQYIENFKHRKTVVTLMDEAFAAESPPHPLHLWLATLSLPLIIESWYDDTMSEALHQVLGEAGWGQMQGLSQSEHFGTWYACYDASGQRVPPEQADWTTLLYRPIGGHAPAANYLVSDADYVEVLTEIDIQTPIPAAVQERRTGRSFLFMGCRFDDQLTRSFARQIMKRSSGRHWAVLPNEPTRMELRFLEEQGITRIAMSLPDALEGLMADLSHPTSGE